MSLSLLDKSVADLSEELPKLSLGELEALLAAEKDGKTRKGAIEAIEAAIVAAEVNEDERSEDAEDEFQNEEPPEEPALPPYVSLKASKINTTVHVGDGRTFNGPVLKDGEIVEEGEVIHDVPAAAAEVIVRNRLAKVVDG